MKLTDLPLFGVMRQRLDWLHQRQQVIAQNIANADTPDYRSNDLKAFGFKEALRRSRAPSEGLGTFVTNDQHLYRKASAATLGKFQEISARSDYETSPNGNQVILEEQMLKMNETAINHSLVTQIYKKNRNMIKTVLGRGGGAA
jgi:flagellar basal-body rod protein FlgB